LTLSEAGNGKIEFRKAKGLKYMNNHDIAVEWFKMAEIDFDSANFLLAMKPIPFEIICYHCRQCKEISLPTL
jgi:hypothetical protein